MDCVCMYIVVWFADNKIINHTKHITLQATQTSTKDHGIRPLSTVRSAPRMSFALHCVRTNYSVNLIQ